jgi:hypothetical protein
MSKRILTAMIIASIAGLLVIGCGDSSSADPLTKTQLVDEANSICTSADAERSEALDEEGDANPGLADLSRSALLPVEEMTEDLAEWTAPPGEAQKVRAIVEAFEAGVAEVRADPADPTVAISAFGEANELAESYGLTACVI